MEDYPRCDSIHHSLKDRAGERKTAQVTYCLRLSFEEDSVNHDVGVESSSSKRKQQRPTVISIILA